MLQAMSTGGIHTIHMMAAGVRFSNTGRELLASYSQDQVYMFDVTAYPRPAQHEAPARGMLLLTNY
jgi:hypothetical protein